MLQQQTNGQFFKMAACIGMTTAVLIPIFGPWIILGVGASVMAAKVLLDRMRGG